MPARGLASRTFEEPGLFFAKRLKKPLHIWDDMVKLRAILPKGRFCVFCVNYVVAPARCWQEEIA